MEQQEALVRQCLEGNPTSAQSTFNELMFARIADKMDTYRSEVASSLYLEPAE